MQWEGGSSVSRWATGTTEGSACMIPLSSSSTCRLRVHVCVHMSVYVCVRLCVCMCVCVYVCMRACECVGRWAPSRRPACTHTSGRFLGLSCCCLLSCRHDRQLSPKNLCMSVWHGCTQEPQHASSIQNHSTYNYTNIQPARSPRPRTVANSIHAGSVEA